MKTPVPAAMPREFHYRVGAPVRGEVPGAHRSLRGGGGQEFRAHAPLVDAPDPRRLDLHASLRDPFGRWLVRLNRERRAVPVVLALDLSASMGFTGERRRLDVVADFAASLAWSVSRNGDSFAAVGADEAVRPEWLLPATRARAAGVPLAQALRGFVPTGRDASGLRLAPQHLGTRRALVFLVSDFHWSDALLAEVLDAFALHDVVPVVVWDRLEYTLGDGAGLAALADPERGTRRTVWWRAALRERWARAGRERREALRRVFAARRLRPLHIDGAFDADAVTRHFLQ
ncbi:DUF58 domain-containing protein [Calidifontimicrobium sp. SYSU G02091]|uniref:DUF58 domain-containing protein n=1 Tax=Calidifontimicrobium sp. SYSU G02091 TaxID=2926421 RepID=UPI001F52B554|nr:DUF58 domain-containing protein [Calidifontimicrobium sp. SYSU G02091]MCI1192579.1 DUF58 domain-containing protein [Calidifontimicrobium sp. SYSU G02091]